MVPDTEGRTQEILASVRHENQTLIFPCSTPFLKTLGMICKMQVMVVCGSETTRPILLRWVTFQLPLIHISQRAPVGTAFQMALLLSRCCFIMQCFR